MKFLHKIKARRRPSRVNHLLHALEQRQFLSTVPVAGGVPILHSNPTATAKLYLDFDGDSAKPWNWFNAPATPAYDIDADATTFSTTELTNIQQIWARLGEKFSPFNIDVTTADPGTLADRVAMKVVIGGNGSWFQSGSYGGASALGAFYDPTLANVAYNFAAALSGNPKTIAEQITFNVGESFGLWKQNSGQAGMDAGSLVGPVMGLRSAQATRGLWWNDPNNDTTGVPQNDLEYLAAGAPGSGYSGLGYRADDAGNSTSTAVALTGSGTTLTRSGIITQVTDVDYYSFTTSGGSVTLTVNPIDPLKFGPMLDAVVELRDSSGTLIASADVGYTRTLPVYAGDTLTRTLAAGTYHVVVRGHGWVTAYGTNGASIGEGADVGQYTLTVTRPNSTGTAPGVVTGVSATGGTNQVALAWTAVAGATAYNVYRSTTIGGPETLVASGVTTNSFTNTGLASGTTYYYRVAATNAYGTGPQSNQVSATTRIVQPGDTNGDGVVNFNDFIVLSNNFGIATSEGAADGDFNADGRVDFADYVILSNNFG